MSELVNRIAWSEPLLPAVPDPEWEAFVKRKTGKVSEPCRRTAPSTWLREACLALEAYVPQHIPPRLVQIASMVTSQENSCRYCYGANRAFLRILGYSEAYIRRLEQETQLAELDEKDRAFVEFCRKLARSRPRPPRAELERLEALGFTAATVSELACMIALGCMYNRVATFLACPPETGFERFAYGPMGRVLGLLGPVVRAVLLRPGKPERGAAAAPVTPEGPYGSLLAALGPLPAAGVFQRAIEGAFAAPGLSRRTKALMFGVVARTLDCEACLREARQLAEAEGLAPAEVEACLTELDSPRLERDEVAVLAWTRDTVQYVPATIQQRTRALGAQIGPEALLEAIGVASLANATVRVATLLA
jgi:alkylhydroperoxidase family enzyme